MGSKTSAKPLSCFRLAYRGDSMCGTFRAGDCLWVAAVPYDSLKIGDVVAMAADGKAIAHRICGKRADGFHTQGDGVLRADCEPLHSDRLMGKIVLRERRGHPVRVRGGWAGHARAMTLHAAWRMASWLLFPLAPVYRCFRKRKWISRIWTPRIRIARFTGTSGETTKYIHRGRTVACWAPGEGRWTCLKPYDLILEPPAQ